jgi:hypothetical protein
VGEKAGKVRPQQEIAVRPACLSLPSSFSFFSLVCSLLGVRSKEGEKAGKVSMQVEVAVRRLCLNCITVLLLSFAYACWERSKEGEKAGKVRPYVASDWLCRALNACYLASQHLVGGVLLAKLSIVWEVRQGR